MCVIIYIRVAYFSLGSTTTDRVAATEDQYIVTDLKGGQTYLVWMDSVSYTGHSDPTHRIHQQTTQTCE